MENFVVSARKYRPQHFSSVVGQSHITTTLKNAILQQHLAHAFLFCGPRGVGKTTCARILAKTINCEHITPEGEACDTCSSCVSFESGSTFNVHELDAASNNSVDDIRELIEQVRFAPQSGRYKVYIIDEVHMLSASAFNAFLKTLEEPPAHAIFILATTEKHKILPTILSRCQIFDFKRITPAAVVAHLQEIAQKEGIQAEPEALQIIAQKCDGCMRDALSILDKIVSFTHSNLTYSNTLEHLNALDEDYFFRLLDMLIQEDLPSVLSLVDEIDAKGFEGDMLLGSLSEFFRNLLVSKDERSVPLLQVMDGFRTKYMEAARSLSTAYVIGALSILNEAEIGYKSARNKKLHVEFHLIKLNYLQQAVTLVAEESGSKKKRLDEMKPVAFRAIGFRPHPQPAVPPAPPPAPTPVNHQPSAPAEPDRPIPPTAGIGALKKIRDQIQNRKKEVATVLPLSDEPVKEAWSAYLERLTANNQVTSHHNLKDARVNITEEHVLEVMADNRVQLQFIEAEKTGLTLHLQEWFNNPKIQISLQMDPQADEAAPVKEQVLSKKDQFIRLVGKYPIVNELKERLNLDLDY